MEDRTKQILIASGILLAGVVLGRGCASGSGLVPPDIEEGVRLVSLQFQGEKPVVLPDGMEVDDVSGTWVRLRLGSEDSGTGRWLDFERVTAYALHSSD